MNYVIKWKPELLFAGGTFLSYVVLEYLRTDDMALRDGGWPLVIGIVSAGFRLAVASLVAPLSAWVTNRKSSMGSVH